MNSESLRRIVQLYKVRRNISGNLSYDEREDIYKIIDRAIDRIEKEMKENEKI